MSRLVAAATKQFKRCDGTSRSHGCAAYQSQLSRLSSFHGWPHLGKLSTLAFSSTGFYYTGQGDVVACFSCGLHLGQWTVGMRPAAAHTKLSGGLCAFLSGNPTACRETLDGMATECTPRTRMGCDMTISDVLAIARDGDERRGQTSAGSVTQRHCCDSDSVKCEAERLNSYTNVWRWSEIVTQQELAAAGFHYAGPGDRVQCAFCQGMLRNWEPGDRPMALHAQHFTYCRFVQGHDVGNVPIPSVSLKGEQATSVEQTASAEAGASLGISFAVPKHPDFAVETRRQATFLTWPGSADSQIVDALSKAGFFYLGAAKDVKCFHCDGTVENWPDDADPWAEHARRYPACAFVTQVKGRAYVEQIGVSSSGSVRALQGSKFAVDPREIRARVDTSKVRILLRMDYPVDLLREVVQKRLADTGDDHETSEALLADVFAVHDVKQQSLQPKSAQGQRLPAALPVVLVSAAAVTSDSGDVATRGSATRCANISFAASEPLITVFEEETAAAVGHGTARCIEPVVVLPSVALDQSAGTPRLNAYEKNTQLKMQLTCKICMDGLIGIVFTPCGHFACCPACAPALTVCPICRVSIRGTVRCVL